MTKTIRCKREHEREHSNILVNQMANSRQYPQFKTVSPRPRSVNYSVAIFFGKNNNKKLNKRIEKPGIQTKAETSNLSS